MSFPGLQTEQVERNYVKEKKAAVKEFDDKKVELKENLIAELEEKKKMIENEKLTMELTGGEREPELELTSGLCRLCEIVLISAVFFSLKQIQWR